MAKQDSNIEKERAEKRRRRFWNACQASVRGWLKRKFHFDYDESFKPEDIDGPLLVAINHTCAYDPLFIGAAFRYKPLTFIASEHIVRSKWGKLLDKYTWLIPHRKGAKGSRTALVALKRIKKGESIFLAVEGEQTWDGRPLPVMPFTGKLVRGSGATLVTYLIEGGYLSAPRWAFGTRRGRVHGHPAGIYSPEVLKEMSDEEVEQLIAKDLAFDVWEWQKSRPEGPQSYKSRKGNADGLERMLFTCPECGALGTLRSDRDTIKCDCGFSIKMADTGFFEEPSPFETLCDWEEADRKRLKEVLEEMALKSGEYEIFSDDNINLNAIDDEHGDELVASGKLTLRCVDGDFVLSIEDKSFRFSDISEMTMVLAGRIVFCDKSGYYELKPVKKSRTNLFKYVVARNLIKE